MSTALSICMAVLFSRRYESIRMSSIEFCRLQEPLVLAFKSGKSAGLCSLRDDEEDEDDGSGSVENSHGDI